MVSLGADCGLRQAEIFGVAPDGVDFLRGAVPMIRPVNITRNELAFAPPEAMLDGVRILDAASRRRLPSPDRNGPPVLRRCAALLLRARRPTIWDPATGERTGSVLNFVPTTTVAGARSSRSPAASCGPRAPRPYFGHGRPVYGQVCS
jgi:hypothetical protein